MEIKNAIIKSTRITISRAGFLSAWLDLDYGGSGQGFGGYALYATKSWENVDNCGRNYAGHFISRRMQIAEVETWDQLVGKNIRVRGDHSGIDSIGHILKENWFSPKNDFADQK